VEYLTAGHGLPSIVALSGLNMPLKTWALVFEELAETSTGFVYNRLGVGASAAPSRPQTGTAIVDLLRAALEAADVQAPYVLVGHQRGGLYVNLYARLFQQELAGALLLAATHPDDDDLERRFPLALAPRHARLHGEQQFAAQVALVIEQAGPFPDVPLTVVSSGRAPPWATVARERIDSHNARKQQLVALSTKGKHIVVPRLGLFPQASDTEVVVQAVREIIASCRN
jgi:pimeloyl-ACP methyl ester carboxylesterase